MFRWSALIALATLSTACGGAAQAEGRTEEPPVEVQVAVATERTVGRSRVVAATLGAEHRVELASQVSGRIEDVLVVAGERVEAGQALVRVRPSDLRDVASRSDAELREARARLEQLESSRAVSPHDLEGARTEVETARAALAAEEREIRAGRARLAALHAQASLDRRAVADTVVRAPFAGRVVRRIAEVGEVATQGSPVLELVDVGPLRVRFEVPEDLALAVATGQRVRVRATMDPERTYDAEIRVVAGALDPLQHPERRGGARRRTPARRRRLRRGRADPGRPGARSDPA